MNDLEELLKQEFGNKVPYSDCKNCKHWNHKEQYEDAYETTRAECWRLVDEWPAHDFVCVHHERRKND